MDLKSFQGLLYLMEACNHVLHGDRTNKRNLLPLKSRFVQQRSLSLNQPFGPLFGTLKHVEMFLFEGSTLQ